MALDEEKENWRLYRSTLYGVAMLIKAVRGLQICDEAKEWLKKIDMCGISSIGTFSEAFKDADKLALSIFKHYSSEYWSCHIPAELEKMDAQVEKWVYGQ